ncbi:hypothetical protein AA14337_2827 [Acetobacter malorum DSM 14337]|uniref:Uncharacterized protein n=1 Tax=Acetobacter malorum DSM 14337 TaxID=1307910 RepID=A0ABQ0PXZ7_9PROT|nr:hypothetical protein AA14337_2827 [Acetobacter malorum DSM 14337]
MREYRVGAREGMHCQSEPERLSGVGRGGCGTDAEHSATAVGEEERRVVQKKQGGGASEQAAGQGEG